MVQANGRRHTFRVRCEEASKVYLVGDFAMGLAQVFDMTEADSGVWQAHLDLGPGEYRFCYYLYDGRTLRYQAPDDARMEGLKAVLSVGAG